jgi:hypothetical protein
MKPVPPKTVIEPAVTYLLGIAPAHRPRDAPPRSIGFVSTDIEYYHLCILSSRILEMLSRNHYILRDTRAPKSSSFPGLWS